MNINSYVPDSLIPILVCFPTYGTSSKFSLLFYENYKNIPQHKVLFDEYVIYTGSSESESSSNYKGYKLGSIEYIFWHETQIWYKNGKRHRENDKPAVVWSDGTQEWYKNGQLHRENDKPATVWSDGTQEWYKNGK